MDRNINNSDRTLDAKVLDKIEIKNGSYTKEFDLEHEYFQDDSQNRSGDFSDQRLKLKSVTEKPSSGIANAPYIFTYYGKTGNINFLPTRLSGAVDHWGYYNGEHMNNKNGKNLPFTKLRYDVTQSIVTCSSGQTESSINSSWRLLTFGQANRETKEETMRWGTLEKIQYPTGGTTTFEFEANCVFNERGIPVKQEDIFLNRQWPHGACIADLSPAMSKTVIFNTDDEVLDFEYVLKAKRAPRYSGNECDPAVGASSIVTLKIYNPDNTLVASLNFSPSQTPVTNDPYASTIYYQEGTQTQKLSAIVTLQKNVAYRFDLWGSNCAANMQFYRYKVVDAVSNRKVGGLRVKKIINSDGINGNSKSYEYQQTDSYPVGKSSGLLHNQPVYGTIQLEALGKCNRSTYEDNHSLVYAPEYYLYTSNASVFPLSSFEGNHITYKTVKEISEINGNFFYTLYNYGLDDYIPEITNYSPDYVMTVDKFVTFPVKPQQPRIYNTQLTYKEVVKNTNGALEYVSSEKYTAKSDPYQYAPSNCINFRSYFCGLDATPHHYWDVYKVRTNSYRLAKVETTYEGAEGLKTTTEYTYDPTNRFLAPTETKTTNSDDKTYTTKTYYAHNLPDAHPNKAALQAGLIAKNMIGIPLQTEQYQGTTKLGGSILEYNAAYQPFKSHVIHKDATTSLSMTIDNYNTLGLPTKMTKAGFSVSQDYGWDTKKRLTNKKVIVPIPNQSGVNSTLETVIDYYDNSNLVKSITSENGTRQKFEYDGLMRLKKTTDRFKGTVDAPTDAQSVTEYSYQYKDATNPFNFVGTKTTIASGGMGTQTILTTKQYMDGLGRPLSIVKENYTPDGKQQKNNVTYDALGRQDKVYQPFEGTALGHETAPAYTDYVQTIYEASPLSRPIEQINPDGTKIKRTTVQTRRLMLSSFLRTHPLREIQFSMISQAQPPVFTPQIPFSKPLSPTKTVKNRSIQRQTRQSYLDP
ncbi:MAG: hypothetical protein HC817_05980 [Saprospiraceae bacterium]|nr:hypothetical protein [Saprospiraceae bacterium]